MINHFDVLSKEGRYVYLYRFLRVQLKTNRWCIFLKVYSFDLNGEHNFLQLLQSYWKGYLVRKHPRQQILDLCCKLKRSAANVDDDMRLINRLVTALSELLGYKSISNIRHTCATLGIFYILTITLSSFTQFMGLLEFQFHYLNQHFHADMATAHSEKCCETLVAAGAINILLKQFHSLNRSVPDQEVLKHVLSILRNIASFPHLADALIKTPQTVEIIFQELLRFVL